MTMWFARIDLTTDDSHTLKLPLLNTNRCGANDPFRRALLLEALQCLQDRAVHFIVSGECSATSMSVGQSVEQQLLFHSTSYCRKALFGSFS